MTLKEFEKLKEEKRKALLVKKSAPRTVEQEEFNSMQKVTKTAEEELVLFKLVSH